MKKNNIFNTLIASAALTGILTAGFPQAALSAVELIKVCKEDSTNNTDAVVYVNHDGSEVSVKGEQTNNGKINKNQVENRLKSQHSLSNSEANSIKDALPDTKIVDMELCELNNSAGIIVSIEAPTIQSTQLPNVDEYYTVDFDDQNTGTAGFSKTNGTTTYTYSSNLEVKTANQWGGAGGSKFITQENIQSIRSYTININEEQKYFGFWWSAGDPYNKITFKKDGNSVAEFKTEDLVDFIRSSGVTNTQDYYGNPSYSSSGGHENEPFSFVNIFFKKGSYDEIVVATLTEGGSAFESDNHTFSVFDQDIIGNILPNVTTPAAINDTITTDEDSSVTANILENDLNPNNDLSLTKITINGTEHNIGSEITLESGALLKVESDGQTTYNPNNKFENLTTADSRLDKFTYTVIDSNGTTDTADVTMEITGVADAPIATDDIATTNEDTSTQINVLANDNDPDSDSDQLKVSQIKGEDVSAGSTVNLTSGASITLNADGTLTYDPTNSQTLDFLNDGDTEDEVFSYQVSDEYGNSDTGNVTVTVTGITDTYAD